MKKRPARPALALLFSPLLIVVSAAVTRAETGVTADEILIGSSINQSGAGSSRSLSLIQGAKIRFEQANREGGIEGRKIRLITYDDGYEPSRTLENTRKLVEIDKVFMLFKYYGTATIKAVLPTIDRADIPMFAPSSGAEFLRNPPLKNVFTTRSGHFREIQSLVEYSVGKANSEFGLFFQDDAYGNEGRNGARLALKNFDLTPVAEAAYKRNSTEVEDAAAKVSEKKPTAILTWAVNQATIEFIRIIERSGLKTSFLGNSTLANPEFAEAVKGIKSSIFVTMSIPLPDDETYEIVRRYRKEVRLAKLAPEPATLEGYVDAEILVEALKRAGKVLTRESLRNTLEKNMVSVNLGGLKVSYGPRQHQGLEDLFVYELKGGHYSRVAAPKGDSQAGSR